MHTPITRAFMQIRRSPHRVSPTCLLTQFNFYTHSVRSTYCAGTQNRSFHIQPPTYNLDAVCMFGLHFPTAPPRHPRKCTFGILSIETAAVSSVSSPSSEQWRIVCFAYSPHSIMHHSHTCVQEHMCVYANGCVCLCVCACHTPPS